MVRGPQTLGELKQGSERLHRFGSLEEVDATLAGLAEREPVARLPRRPGQKEDRYAQLLGGEAGTAPAEGEEPGPRPSKRILWARSRHGSSGSRRRSPR
jgi:uncharacterized protein YceH (UPF0502 family)